MQVGRLGLDQFAYQEIILNVFIN